MKTKITKNLYLGVDDGWGHIEDCAHDRRASARRREMQRGPSIAVADTGGSEHVQQPESSTDPEG